MTGVVGAAARPTSVQSWSFDLPHIDTQSKRGTDAIEGMRAAVREMRQGWKWRRLDGDYPRALVLAGDGGLGLEGAADHRDELTEKLARSGRAQAHAEGPGAARSAARTTAADVLPPGCEIWGIAC